MYSSNVSVSKWKIPGYFFIDPPTTSAQISNVLNDFG